MEDNRPYKIPWPKGMTEYIIENCAQHYYMFFSTKHGVAACTHCGSEFNLSDLPTLQHESGRKLRVSCPECGKQMIPKDMRYGRKKLTDNGRITWIRGYGPVTFIETDIFTIDYKLPHPTVIISPDQQIRISKKSQERYDWRDSWYGGGDWIKIKTIAHKAAPQIYGVSDWHDHLYLPEEYVNPGTDLQYANLDVNRFADDWFSDHFMIDKLIRYMSDFLKYPATEILEKSGFEDIVMDRAKGAKTRYLNMRAKDLRKILKVNGADVKKLRDGNPSIAFLDSMGRIRKYAPWASVDDIDELCRIMNRWIDTRKMGMITTHVDMSKLLKRMLDYRRRTGSTFTISDYGDYLEAVLLLGMRLDKKTLYPADFAMAHDEAIDEAERQKPTIEVENFTRFQKEITGMEDPFILGTLMIRPAATPQELRDESQALNHCVRTYIDRVSRGTTSILFIRKTEEPNVPYFTLELNPNGRVVQCRGDHNCGYPEEVKQFIDKWMSWRKKERMTA